MFVLTAAKRCEGIGSHITGGCNGVEGVSIMTKIMVEGVGDDDRPTVISLAESKIQPGRFDVMLIVGNFPSEKEAEDYADDLADLLGAGLGARFDGTHRASIVEDN